MVNANISSQLIRKEIIQYGRALAGEGLNHLRSGNLSICQRDVIFITRTGAELGNLKLTDIISLNIQQKKVSLPVSVELPTHRAIYQANPLIKAVAHSHGVYSNLVALDQEMIIPLDWEGKWVFPKVPVFPLPPDYQVGTVVPGFPEVFRDYRLGLLRGHGAFSGGANMAEAAALLSAFEYSCKMLYLHRLLNMPSSGGFILPMKGLPPK